jgi:hypothetical protein
MPPDQPVQMMPKHASVRRTVEDLLRSLDLRHDLPLPTTRSLALRLQVSPATVHRVLQELAAEGGLTRGRNGRYFPVLAGEAARDRSAWPVVFLMGRMKEWDLTMRDILHAATRQVAQYQRGLFAYHIDCLISQDDARTPPRFASAGLQMKLLGNFLSQAGEAWAGAILENMWDDGVIARYRNEFQRIVVIDRECAVEGVSSVFPDFDRAAALVVGHALARGYERLVVARPYDDEFVRQLSRAVRRVSASIGAFAASIEECNLADPAARDRLIRGLKAPAARTCVFCLEDNHGAHLRADLALVGTRCPERVGIIVGTGVLHAGPDPMSSLVIDFSAVGRLAVDLLHLSVPQTRTVPVSFAPGVTT